VLIRRPRVPRYDYACTACDHRFEAVQSFIDGPLTECPVCGGRLRKLFSAVGVVFKGSGFYRNDSRPKDAAASGDGASSPSKATAEAKTDTKSETKSDTKSDAKSDSKSDTGKPAAVAAPSTSSTTSKSA